MNNQFIISPFNYTGGKYKLLTQLLPLFKKTGVFLDLFCGGANVGINIDAPLIILNDINGKVIKMIDYFKNTDTFTLFEEIESIISTYNLSRSSIYGHAYYGSTGSLANYNKENYLKLRTDYNQSIKDGKEDILKLYLLIVFAFNYQIRFNKKGEYNMPVGKYDFNLNMQNKLERFSRTLKEKNIILSNKDFREYNIEKLPKYTFVYCDPPYILSTATYNEQGGWTEGHDRELLDFLTIIDKKGFSFALSNVLESKGNFNVNLDNWIKKHGYICHFLNANYRNCSYHKKDKTSKDVEVLITNY